MKKKLFNKVKRETIIAIVLGLIGVFLVGTGILAYQKSVNDLEQTKKVNAEHAIEMCQKQLNQNYDYGIKITEQTKVLSEARTAFREENYHNAKKKADSARIAAFKLYQKQLVKKQ